MLRLFQSSALDNGLQVTEILFGRQIWVDIHRCGAPSSANESVTRYF